MIRVQNPPTLPIHNHHHRRHPSSPAAVYVQPTQIPGLLSLSKPQSARRKLVLASPSPSPARHQKHTSPSRSTPSQAEGPSDPFAFPSPSSPKPRQQQQRRRPIPITTVPTLAQRPPPQAARSVPLPHHRPAKHTRTVAPAPATLLPPFDFPICDDLSDHDDPRPTTPTRRRPHKPTHPTNSNTSVKRPNPRARNHKRAPSDSGMVFNMSSDESGPENNTMPDELNALFLNLALTRRGMGTPPRSARNEAMYEAMAQREVSGYTGGRGAQGHAYGYFASSSFQNSPSPEELPDPLFV
ncbi:hypothetical protein C0991_003777 [Blastosporella zonata]|nr:hypothetical protein C0991_003777 [Blastosporella zonata]